MLSRVLRKELLNELATRKLLRKTSNIDDRESVLAFYKNVIQKGGVLIIQKGRVT